MFLNSLNQKEKDSFMKLAVAIIKADGVVEESEKQILSAYANEMQISVCDIDVQCDINSVIDELASSSSPQTKRIIFLELLALAFADGNYAFEEKVLVQKMINSFGLDNAFVEQAINLEDAYIAAYMSLIHLVEEGD